MRHLCRIKDAYPEISKSLGHSTGGIGKDQSDSLQLSLFNAIKMPWAALKWQNYILYQTPYDTLHAVYTSWAENFQVTLIIFS